MKITICASVDFTPKIKEVADLLSKQGHDVEIPYYSKKILSGKASLDDYKKVKEKGGDMELDAVLILNLDKKGVKNYKADNS